MSTAPQPRLSKAERTRAQILAAAEARFAAHGFQAVRNATYKLHPSTLAFEFARRFPARTLCFEVRRDLLLEEFVPFVELSPRAELVERAAAPMVEALV